jgi:glycosyltransferase involved in cell wall biosynthesis
MNESKISIVIPVFNSAVTLQELCSRIHQTMTGNGNSYELILVDDGSADNSWDELSRIKSTSGYSITPIKLSKNFGQHNAILCGLNFCKGNVVITMDDDLQHPPEEIPKLIRAYETTDADIVYGIPLDKKHSSVRNAGSFFIRVTSDHSSENNRGGSSFRLIKISLAKKLLENHSHNFLFIDAVLGWYTGKIENIVVEHHPRKAGRSGYTVKALIYTYIDILINYSAGPLKFLTYGGLLMSVLSFIIGLRFIYKKIIYDVPLGYTSLIVSILFSTSLILFCLGIIGQYLYKLYQLQNKRPPYSIETQL